MVIKIGGWCQGILEFEEEITVERWQWVQDPDESQGTWDRVVRFGKGALPCDVATRDEPLTLGTELQYLGLPWAVMEVSKW